MQIEVYMDDEDKEQWYQITELYNATIKNQSLATELKNKTALFWQNIIEKYGVLRNKQLHVDQVQGTINSWSGLSELKYKSYY